ncbi:alpha/beta hydrolase family protein [Nibrella saemangeumensis]
MFTFALVSGLSVLMVLGSTGCQSERLQEEQSQEAVAPLKPALVDATLIGAYSADQLRNRFSGSQTALRFLIRHGIKAYRIVYNTTNTDGKTIQASGALLVPDSAGTYSMISMQHGTIHSDYEAPSNYKPGSEAYTFGSVFSSIGYIIAAPDYIGYGASRNLPHPYEHRESLATASFDMLRAAREFMENNKTGWDKRLFIAGYSEGGFATMSLQKKLEEEYPGEFNLVASSAGAGAYHKTAFMKYLVNNQTHGISGFNRNYLWVMLTYNRLYSPERPVSYYAKPPYAERIKTQQQHAGISVSLNQIFTDEFRQAINNGTDKAFLGAVADNDVYDWKPKTPTQLYHGDADNMVFYFNSRDAYDAMRKRGATNVELITLRGRNHGTAIIHYILGTFSFFNTVGKEA